MDASRANAAWTATSSGNGTGATSARIDFLASATHGGVERVERFETHGNLVFLAGAEAFKIKRAVRFEYMDFSTLEKRRVACLREVEVNRRWAPTSILGAWRSGALDGIYPLMAMARSSNGPSTCGGSIKRSFQHAG